MIEKTPASRRCDLVFLQNGFLEDYLESKGLADNTQVRYYVPALNYQSVGCSVSALALTLTLALALTSRL